MAVTVQTPHPTTASIIAPLDNSRSHSAAAAARLVFVFMGAYYFFITNAFVVSFLSGRAATLELCRFAGRVPLFLALPLLPDISLLAFCVSVSYTLTEAVRIMP